MMKQKIAVSLPGPTPTQNIDDVVAQAVRPVQQQVADLQAQVRALQQQPVPKP